MNCLQNISVSVSLSPLDDTDILSHTGRQRAPSLLSTLHSSLKSKTNFLTFPVFPSQRLLSANFLPTEPRKFLYFFPIPMACLYSDSQALKQPAFQPPFLPEPLPAKKPRRYFSVLNNLKLFFFF